MSLLCSAIQSQGLKKKKNPGQTSGIKSGNSFLGLTHLKENSMFTMSENVW